MPTRQSLTHLVLRDRPRFSLEIASIEYCVQWDDAAQSWDVLRNGVAKEARKMRASAVATAIRDAKAEFKAFSGTVIVTCLDGRERETLWRATQ